MELGVVSIFSIVGMLFSLLLILGLPCLLIVLIRERYSAKWSSIFIGAGIFILFAMVLEQMFHGYIISVVGQELLMGNMFVYAIYGGLAAAAFEETGRLLVMKYFVRKNRGLGDALFYGVGHGGIEAILLVGLVQISNIASSILINNGGIMSTLNGLEESMRATMLDQLSALWNSPSYLFYLSGIERGLAIVGHICFTLLIYLGVSRQRKYLVVLGYAAHFSFNAISVLLNTYVGTVAAEFGLLLMVVLLGIFIKNSLKKNIQ